MSSKFQEDDLEFYYFMRYGKIPKRVLHPDLVKPESTSLFSMNGLKAFSAFIAIFFFFALFVLLTHIGFNVLNPDFSFYLLNVTLRDDVVYS